MCQYTRYQRGESPREIVEALGYEPDILGASRLSELQMNIKKQANRPGGFTEGKNNRKGQKAEMTSVDENEYYKFVTTGVYPLDIPNPPTPPVIKKQPEELYCGSSLHLSLI